MSGEKHILDRKVGIYLAIANLGTRVTSIMFKAERIFPLSILSFLIGIASGVFSVWATFSFQPEPQLTFTVLSDSSVSDLLTEFPGVSVQVGRSPLPAGYDLRVIRLRLGNTGNIPIRINDFDPHAPLQVVIKSAILVGRRNFGWSDSDIRFGDQDILDLSILTTHQVDWDALSKSTGEKIEHDVFIDIEPAVIDPGTWYDIGIAVIHNSETKTSIQAIGKVAGIKEVFVDDLANFYGQNDSSERNQIASSPFLGIISFLGWTIALLSTFYSIYLWWLVTSLRCEITAFLSKPRRRPRKRATEIAKGDDSSDIPPAL